MESKFTREFILKIAAKEFLSKRYEEVRTRDIARASDISEALLFKYFSSKEQLYIAAVDYMIRVYRKTAFQCYENYTAVEILQHFAKDMISPDEKTPEFMRFLGSAIRKQISHTTSAAVRKWDQDGLVESVLVPVIENGIRDGIIKEINAKLFAGIYYRYIIGCMAVEETYTDLKMENNLLYLIDMVTM